MNTSAASISELRAEGISIHAKDLSKKFNREWVFRNLSFDFTPGNKYVITGPNGSGKSTLLQVLCGHIPPTGGSVTYAKSRAVAIDADKIYAAISVAAPYMELIDEFTLSEQLAFHFKLKKPREGLDVDSILQKMYLHSARDKYLQNFSSGMKQRLKLGMAFYADTPLIILDEPGSNLDAQAFAWYKNEIESTPKDATLIIASNNAVEYPEKCVILNLLDYKPSLQSI